MAAGSPVRRAGQAREEELLGQVLHLRSHAAQLSSQG